MAERPEAAAEWIGGVEWLTCGVCGGAAPVDGWDVLGAEEGCLFCPLCWAECDARARG